jgi:hypothetical protein
MARLRFALALLTLALAKPHSLAFAGSACCPGAFYSDDTGTCGRTGYTCGRGTGCMYDCERNSGCYGPWC